MSFSCSQQRRLCVGFSFFNPHAAFGIVTVANKAVCPLFRPPAEQARALRPFSRPLLFSSAAAVNAVCVCAVQYELRNTDAPDNAFHLQAACMAVPFPKGTTMSKVRFGRHKGWRPGYQFLL